MSLPQTQDDAKTVSDAWDYKGRPAVRSATGGWTSAAMILGLISSLIYFMRKTRFFFLFWVLIFFLFLGSVVEAFERLTTLSIAVNLVTYLTGTMHLGNATSANTVTNFLGTSFMLCLLGGFIADTYLGR